MNQLQKLANVIAAQGGYPDSQRAYMDLMAYANKNGIQTPAMSSAVAGDVSQLLNELPKTVQVASDRDSFRRGFFGAAIEGANRTMQERTGYPDPNTIKRIAAPEGAAFDAPVAYFEDGKVVPNQTFVPASSVPRPQYGRDLWEVSSKGAEYNSLEEAGFNVGKGIGNIASNAFRNKLWNIHPWEVIQKNTSKVALGDPSKGMPQPEAFVNPDRPLASPVTLKGSTEAALIAALGGFGAVEAVAMGSGNYDPLNLKEGGRSKGFSALTAEEGGDQRVPTSVISDVVQRHFFGRKGRVLPWEQFRLERPDVSYDQYQNYRNWQYGKSDNDPLNDLTLGLAKFTGDGLSGSPEFSMMGASITPVGAAAALGVALGTRKLNHVLGAKAFDRFAELDKMSYKGGLSPEDLAEYQRNPFFVNAYGNASKGVPPQPVRAAQYKHMINTGQDRW